MLVTCMWKFRWLSQDTSWCSRKAAKMSGSLLIHLLTGLVSVRKEHANNREGHWNLPWLSRAAEIVLAIPVTQVCFERAVSIWQGKTAKRFLERIHTRCFCNFWESLIDTETLWEDSSKDKKDWEKRKFKAKFYILPLKVLPLWLNWRWKHLGRQQALQE